jgi:hypothetical protein
MPESEGREYSALGNPKNAMTALFAKRMEARIREAGNDKGACTFL